ncbi:MULTISPECIES: hypothetical protein [unclassified Microcoleus]|uniref:hypothetical protein n=1 Tax=unclassified Microcoleus TaxID=2642155 RepID=UPI002FD4F4A3
MIGRHIGSDISAIDRYVLGQVRQDIQHKSEILSTRPASIEIGRSLNRTRSRRAKPI